MNLMAKTFLLGLERSNMFIGFFTKDMAGDDWLQKPTGIPNSSLWILGHLAFQRALFLELLTGRKTYEDAWVTFFKMGGEPQNADLYPDVETCLEFLEARLVDLKEYLETATKEDLERQKEQELLIAESTGADKALIEEKFSKFSKKIDKEQRRAQVGEALAAFDAIAGLAAGNAEAAKAIAIAQSIINGFQGVTAVLAAKSTIPEPAGSIVKGVTAAAVGATALINVNKIRSTPVPKAAKGGIFGGRLHSEGGTKGYFDDGTQIEVERGELFAVVNRNSTGMLNNLSNLNEAGGGVSFGRGGTKSFLQDGGVAIDNISGSIDSEIEANLQIVSAVESLPPPVVVVQDINEVQGETIAVEQRAII